MLVNDFEPRIADTIWPGDTTDVNETKRTTSDSESDAGKRSLPASEYKSQVDTAIQRKEYNHWESAEAKEENRQRIENYDVKKRAADLSSLRTQSAVLSENGAHFTDDNLARIQQDFGSNKLEIYNERTFEKEKVSKENRNKVVGLREISDGKICVKDTDDIDAIRHIATHETFHDLSFQSRVTVDSKTYLNTDNKLVEDKRTLSTSGIHQITEHTIKREGKVIERRHGDYFRQMNEGITEYKTIQEMKRRGEFPGFDSYTEQVGWAKRLEDKVGKETLDAAYFGGELSKLAQKVDEMSSSPDAWMRLNNAMDNYARARTAQDRAVYKEEIGNILDDM